jgi:hypothetical protein
MKFQWEQLDDKTQRAKVVGGWIINTIANRIYKNSISLSEALVFVPDPDWQWEIEK